MRWRDVLDWLSSRLNHPHASIRLLLQLLLPLTFACPAPAQLAHGINPNNLGKGDWIWQMSACQTALGVSTPQAVMNYEASKGMQWVTVKGADGGNTNGFTQFNPSLVAAAHTAGLKIFAWAYVYGTNGSSVQAEVNAALTLLAEGADGFIIDAEAEYEGQPVSAAQYCQAIRAQYPNTFLAYAPFPYINYHPTFPYIQFGTNCDAVMPQDYWAAIGVSVNQMVSDMDTQWRNWQNGLTGIYTNAIKPIIPIGQGYDISPSYTETAAEITNFVYLLKTDANPAGRGGYHGVSFWSCQHHTAADWSGIAASTIGSFVNPPAISVQPSNVAAAAGSLATFNVAATGQGTLNYQWQFNQTILPGATSTSYTLTNVQIGNAGAYSVVVTNPGGSTQSGPAFLSVIAQLTNGQGAIVAPTGLADWWPAEGNATDLFGPYDGSPHGGFSYAAGKEGLAFHFDGTGSYLALGGPSLTAPWTLCLWVNRQNAPGTSAALLSDGTYSLKLEQYNATRKVGVTQLGVGDYAFNYIAPAGIWTFLALVGTSSGTALYANGVLQGSLTNVVPLPRGYLGATYVSSGARFVDYTLGSLDEIMCFNRALSGSEISAVYAAGSDGVVRAPQFVSITSPAPGQALLSLRGLTGRNFTLLSSTNLLDWTVLAQPANPSGTLQYLDQQASPPVLFYRARQP